MATLTDSASSSDMNVLPALVEEHVQQRLFLEVPLLKP